MKISTIQKKIIFFILSFITIMILLSFIVNKKIIIIRDTFPLIIH